MRSRLNCDYFTNRRFSQRSTFLYMSEETLEDILSDDFIDLRFLLVVTQFAKPYPSPYQGGT